MSLFGISVMFTTLSEAWTAWYNIADEVEEVQYMEGNRGRGRKRRRITTTVKHFIARAARYKSMANEDSETAQWVELCDTVEKQYTSMLETKSVVNQDLDNVW